MWQKLDVIPFLRNHKKDILIDELYSFNLKRICSKWLNERLTVPNKSMSLFCHITLHPYYLFYNLINVFETNRLMCENWFLTYFLHLTAIYFTLMSCPTILLLLANDKLRARSLFRALCALWLWFVHSHPGGWWCEAYRNHRNIPLLSWRAII